MGVLPETDPETPGVWLHFKPERARLGVDRVEDFAPLGPEHCIPSVGGLGRILRILRVGRVAAPDPAELVGDVERTTQLLEKALGTLMRLELKPRSRLTFTAWTDEGMQTLTDVHEVHELPDGFLVSRRGGRFPTRFAREDLVRHHTECERWFEIVDISRI